MLRLKLKSNSQCTPHTRHQINGYKNTAATASTNLYIPLGANSSSFSPQWLISRVGNGDRRSTSTTPPSHTNSGWYTLSHQPQTRTKKNDGNREPWGEKNEKRGRAGSPRLGRAKKKVRGLVGMEAPAAVRVLSAGGAHLSVLRVRQVSVHIRGCLVAQQCSSLIVPRVVLLPRALTSARNLAPYRAFWIFCWHSSETIGSLAGVSC